MTRPALRLGLTRPHGLGASWAAAARSAGWQVTHYPLLDIEPLPAPLPAAAGSAQGWIFVSPSAVACAWPLLAAAGLPVSGQRLAAPGSGTAEALLERGQAAVIAPEGVGDSTLLLPLLPAVAGEHWILVRGEGGRATLAHALRERGVSVHDWVIYRRRADEAALGQLLQELPQLDALLFTSSDAVRTLFAHAGESQRQRLQSKALIVLHPHIAAAARSCGAQRVAVCTSVAALPALLAGMTDDAPPEDTVD